MTVGGRVGVGTGATASACGAHGTGAVACEGTTTGWRFALRDEAAGALPRTGWTTTGAGWDWTATGAGWDWTATGAGWWKT
jgi:hypothetical protein